MQLLRRLVFSTLVLFLSPSTTNASTGISSQPTLGDIILSEDDLAILLTLVERTDVLGLLSDPSIDPLLTLFAPINDAFLTLTRTEVELSDRVLNREDFALHRLSLLLTHATDAGAVFASSLVDGQVVTALNEEPLTIGVDVTTGVSVSSVGSTVQVVEADIEAVNGVLHKIDGVLLPYWWMSDLDAVVEGFGVRGYTTADDLFLQIGGVGEFLCEGTIGTIFLPDDAALADLSADDLFLVLSNHIVLGVHTTLSLAAGDVLTTLAGCSLEVTEDDSGSLTIGGASILLADILANDGVVHGISAPLVPCGDAVPPPPMPMEPEMGPMTPEEPTVPAPMPPAAEEPPAPMTPPARPGQGRPGQGMMMDGPPGRKEPQKVPKKAPMKKEGKEGKKVKKVMKKKKIEGDGKGKGKGGDNKTDKIKKLKMSKGMDGAGDSVKGGKGKGGKGGKGGKMKKIKDEANTESKDY